MRAYVLVGISKRLTSKHTRFVLKNKRLIDLVIDNLISIGIEPIIYSKVPIESTVPVIIDNSKWLVESIYSLLKRDDGFFVFGGDMPLIRKEAVNYILKRFCGKTIIPYWKKTGYLEPLHGIYTRSVAPCLKDARSLTCGLKNCQNVDFITAENLPEETFFNVNTLDDLELLKKIVSENKHMN